MKILITGGAGYIGSHTVRVLSDRGHAPVVFDNLSSGHAWAVPEEVLVRGDLADREGLSKLFAAHRFDAVLHFASFIQVGESVTLPLKYYRNNVANAINLLSVMEEAEVRRFVFHRLPRSTAHPTRRRSARRPRFSRRTPMAARN